MDMLVNACKLLELLYKRCELILLPPCFSVVAAHYGEVCCLCNMRCDTETGIASDVSEMVRQRMCSAVGNRKRQRLRGDLRETFGSTDVHHRCVLWWLSCGGQE